ncbi:MAG: FAD:protein FMN transferase [Abitibacteriaceae bacterium]|nr:FAD:protein FMN transferase [Abditibacteriaceae bacterium]
MKLRRFEYAQLEMGVQTRLVVYTLDQATAERACTAAFNRIAQLEDIMSDYRPTSELMRLCARAGGPPIKVSDDLFFVLQRSQEVAARSHGAFDITVGPYVALWRRARKQHVFPTTEELAQAGKLVGWQKVRLGARHKTVQLLVLGMRLDLGGIAKGYAGDCALDVLQQFGITRALFESGGDIVMSDPPPGKAGWNIEILNAGQELKQHTRLLANAAISTSGDTEQFVTFNGQRYSHIVDPRTGLGLTDRIAVTIIAPKGITSDSLSTAVSVLGAQQGQRLAKSYPGTWAYIRRDHDKVQ